MKVACYVISSAYDGLSVRFGLTVTSLFAAKRKYCKWLQTFGVLSKRRVLQKALHEILISECPEIFLSGVRRKRLEYNVTFYIKEMRLWLD